MKTLMTAPAQWHLDHCTIETETERLSGSFSAYCIEHLIDVTDILPDEEPDLYQNSEENIYGRES